MQSVAPTLVETLKPEHFNRNRLESLGAGIAAGRLIPFLGPGLMRIGPPTDVPATPESLALALHDRNPVGVKLRGNLWGTAQFIEQRRHRKTLIAFMSDIYKVPVEPGHLQSWLASKDVPLIIDTWYDGALANAFRASGKSTFGEIQGVTRALENRDVWTKAYRYDGTEVAAEAAAEWRTVLYEPHGCARPAQNFIVAESDYVEVLTEIDIQSPIPDVVKELRANRGFVFIGCRFDDQILRTYARQIMKRSTGPRYAIIDFEPTRMEERFLAEQNIEPVVSGLAHAVEVLTSI